MNKIESLPKMLSYGDHVYFLELHVNFRGNLVIGYKSGENSLLTYVVEAKNEPYIPDGILSDQHTFNENIGNCKTLDECVEQISKKILECNIREYIGNE